MKLDFLRRLAISFTVLLFGVVFSREIFLPNPPQEFEEDNTITRIKKTINRKIASIENSKGKAIQKNYQNPSLTTSRSQFKDVEVSEDMSSSENTPETSDADGSQTKSSVSRVGRSIQPSRAMPKSASSPTGRSLSSSIEEDKKVMSQPIFDPNSSSDEDPSNESEGSGTNSNNFMCSTSIGGGAYGNPVSVALTCTSASTLKFCLQEGSCCDPNTVGTVYSSPIVIGTTDGNYCLTYVGSGSSGSTGLLQQTYTISNTLPHLLVNVPKRYYQTTQLPGVHHLHSNHFGDAGFTVGEINLKSHDPGPLGLNLNCTDIITNHAALSSPTPEEMFAALLTSSIPSGNQINVPFPVNKIVYGNNFITSFVTNSNHSVDIHSCSTNNIRVADFELFPLEATHGEVGNNTVREFSGGFIGYSFFEPESNLNRTPAGASVEDEAGQELRTNSFSIYH